MFEAQHLFYDDEAYSAWMPRQGDNATVTAELIDTNGVRLTVSVFHKNEEDTGDGTSAGIFTVSAVGRADKEILGLKELVRYKFQVTSASARTDYVLFRMLAPVWFDTMDAS